MTRHDFIPRLCCAAFALTALHCASQSCGTAPAAFQIAHTRGEEAARVQRLRAVAPGCIELEVNQTMHFAAHSADVQAWDRLDAILHSREFADAIGREQERLKQSGPGSYNFATFEIGNTRYGAAVDTKEPLIHEALLLLDRIFAPQFGRYDRFIQKKD